MAITLTSMQVSLQSYLRLLVFRDGDTLRPCSEQGVLAFTATGSRIIFVCGRTFERSWRRNLPELRATVIHEVLHSLGLGEHPPSPRYITYRVQQLCW